jgi:hypothetical protein
VTNIFTALGHWNIAAYNITAWLGVSGPERTSTRIDGEETEEKKRKEKKSEK